LIFYLPASTASNALIERLAAAEMFNTAYDKLVALGTTPWLAEVLQVRERAHQPDSGLRHLMICFDDGPCSEFICSNFAEKRSE
jgi:hypothetical protein